MESIKNILEKIVRAIIIASVLMGVTSSVLLFRFYLRNYPIIINFYPQEINLIFCMIVVSILSIRFRVKYFKWIVLAGTILTIINLIGFNFY